MSFASPGGAALGSHQADELAYPRPQFRRSRWASLDGTWSFSRSPGSHPKSVIWSDTIEVPYPPESRLSGLALEGELPVVWYRRTFEVPEAWDGERLLLHFGAVDYRAEVWLNGHRAGGHEGGYTPFTIDVTELVREGGSQDLCVRAEDPPADMRIPRGKQDWKPEAHSIWYPRTTGIWQPVWLEPVPANCIDELRLTPDLAEFAVKVELGIAGEPEGLEVEFELTLNGERLARARCDVTSSRLTHTLHLPDPGIDDARNEFLWSPEKPTLLDLRLTLRDETGKVDRVESYVGLRSVECREGRFFLNGRPYFQRLVLDQGYWEGSLLAAPSAEALRRDVELAKEMGFNGVRKHQKLEDPRYLYWADRLGLLVWNELPSAYSFGPESIRGLLSSCEEAIARDYNHPSVVAWVPINESWGVPDLPIDPRQRNLVAALFHLARSLDGTRAVIDNDGWEHGNTDLFTVHDYTRDPGVLAERYGDIERWRDNRRHLMPAGRALSVSGAEPPDALLVSEFGGIRFGEAAGGWGYSEARSASELLERLGALVDQLSAGDAVIGYCYTQFSDTFQEQNGLLYADRTPKVPIEALAETFSKGGRD